jgi:CrcB protein
MARLLWICFAGALGTAARYGIGLWATRTFPGPFPYGTLIVNLVGCFFIAAVMVVSLQTTMMSPTLRMTLTTGFVGGLTTYSSFNLETTRLLQERTPVGLLYLAVTLFGCAATGLLGLALARRLVGG